MDKRNWVQALTLALCVVLIGLNFWQLRQISDLRVQLSNVNANVRVWTEDIKTYVASQFSRMESADALVQDWEVISVEPDRASRRLRAEVSLRLKEWREDTQVWLAAVQGPDTQYTAMVGGAGHYSGAVIFPVNNDEVRLFARVSAQGLQREEDLFSWGSASMLLPVQCCGWGSGGPYYARNADKSGTLTVDPCEVNLTGFEGETDLPQLSGQVFRLRRNGEIAAEKTAMFGNTIGQYSCEELSAEAGIGDEFTLTFFCRDESGLGYEFFLDEWSIGEDGISGRADWDTDWPRLTWD